MLKRSCLFLFSLSVLSAGQSFLTPKEHGEMIYHEARGVACVSCHGKNAEGRIVATYTHKKMSHTVFAPPLTNLDATMLKTGLKNHDFGPPYHLSDEEFAALTAYLKR